MAEVGYNFTLSVLLHNTWAAEMYFVFGIELFQVCSNVVMKLTMKEVLAIVAFCNYNIRDIKSPPVHIYTYSHFRTCLPFDHRMMP